MKGWWPYACLLGDAVGQSTAVGEILGAVDRHSRGTGVVTADAERALFPALSRLALPRFVLAPLLLQCLHFSLSQEPMLGTTGTNSSQQQCTIKSPVLPFFRTAHGWGIKRPARPSVNSTTRGWLRGALHRYDRRTPTAVLRGPRTSVSGTTVNPQWSPTPHRNCYEGLLWRLLPKKPGSKTAIVVQSMHVNRFTDVGILFYPQTVPWSPLRGDRWSAHPRRTWPSMGPHLVDDSLCPSSAFELPGARRTRWSRPPRAAIVSTGFAQTRCILSTQDGLVAGATLSRPRARNATSLREIVSRSTWAATNRVQTPRVGSFTSLSTSRQVVITQNEQRSRHIRSVQACSLLLSVNVSSFFMMIEWPLLSIAEDSSCLPLNRLHIVHPPHPPFSRNYGLGSNAPCCTVRSQVEQHMQLSVLSSTFLLSAYSLH